MSQLFTPLSLRSLTLPNRIVVSPMCTYSARDGFANDFHLVHLGQFALGRAGLVLAEATAVSPEGRISPDDLGLWKDEQVARLADISDFVHAHGGLIGVQLAHAGRKASTYSPFKGRGGVPDEAGGWEPIGPGSEPFTASYRTPRAMTRDDITEFIENFRLATKRAILAGFDVVEIHAAHGYLLHEFLSPLSNTRDDEYGGSFENRTRLLLEVTRVVRGAWPDHLPLFVRLSATDWVEGGWDVDQTVEVSRLLADEGVDVVDVSSGGLSPLQDIHVAAGYQVPFAARVKSEAGVPTMAVGLLTDPVQCEEVLQSGQADLVAVAREFLRDPHFALRAAKVLGDDVAWVPQYERAK